MATTVGTRPRQPNRVERLSQGLPPGEQASAWQDCLDGEYICIGWDELGDLSLYDTFEEFSKAFARTYPQNTDRQNLLAAKNIWKFRNLKPGNHVVANKGTTEILGIGTVRATAISTFQIGISVDTQSQSTGTPRMPGSWIRASVAGAARFRLLRQKTSPAF